MYGLFQQSPTVNYSHPLMRGLQGWWLTGPSQTGNVWRDIAFGKKAIATGTLPGTIDYPAKTAWPRKQNKLSSYHSTDWYWDTGLTTLNSVTTYSYSFWCRRNASGSILGVGVATAGGSSQSNRDSALIFSDPNVYIAFGSIYGTIPYGSADLAWHHIVVTYDGNQSTSATRAIAYFDGVKTTFSGLGTVPTVSVSHSGATFFIGRDPGLPSYTRGYYDDIRVWNRALSESEARLVFQNSGNNFMGLLTPTQTTINYINNSIQESVSDTLSLTQDCTEIEVYSQSLTSTISFTDDCVENEIYTHSITSTLSFTDEAIPTYIFDRLISDTISFTDVATGNYVLNYSLSDTIIFTDLIQQIQNPSNTISLTQAVLENFVFSRNLSDTLTLTENLSNSVIHTISEEDTLTFSQNLDKVREINANLEDTLILVQVLDTDFVINFSVEDTISLTQSANYEAIALSDSCSFTHTIVSNCIFSRDISDTISFSENVSNFLVHTSSLSDNISFTDLAQGSKDLICTDTLSLTQDTLGNFILNFSLEDTILLDDNVDYGSIILQDTLNLTQNISNSTEFSRELINSITFTDIVETIKISNPFTSNEISLTDLAEYDLIFFRNVEDTLSITDEITIDSLLEINITHTLDLSDLANETENRSLAVSDSLILNQQLLPNLIYNLSIADTLICSHNADYSGIELDSTCSFTDEVTVQVIFSRSLFDSLVITDNVTSSSIINRLINTQLNLTDFADTDQLHFEYEVFVEHNLVLYSTIPSVIRSRLYQKLAIAGQAEQSDNVVVTPNIDGFTEDSV